MVQHHGAIQSRQPAFQSFAETVAVYQCVSLVAHSRNLNLPGCCLPPLLAAAGGSAGHAAPAGHLDQAEEGKWMDGTSLRAQGRGGFFTPQLLNDFFQLISAVLLFDY